MSCTRSGGSTGGGRRIPTPMPPPKENMHYPYRSTPRLIGSDASYQLNASELQALNAVKATAPKMDKNGYFYYVAATAKKKKINLMQSRPPRVAFTEDVVKVALRRGLGCHPESVAPCGCGSSGSITRHALESTLMSQRASPPVPRARLTSQLECYQPRYHAIRDRELDPRRVQVQQDYVDHHRNSRAHLKKYSGRPDGSSIKSHHVNSHGPSAQNTR